MISRRSTSRPACRVANSGRFKAVAKSYEDYDFNSRNSYNTTPVAHLQERASGYFSMSQFDITFGDLKSLSLSIRLRESLYRAARIRMGLVESDYNFG